MSDTTLSRQEALRVIWRRLLIVFIAVVVLCISFGLFAGNLRTTVFIFLAGNVGGYIGVHRNLGGLKNEELEELSRSWLGIVVPSFAGGILAWVLYLLFLSGLLAGDLFPHFEADADAAVGFESLFDQHGKTFADYGKLFFWAFVAGFNQKYVVDIINSVRSTSVPKG